MRCAKFGLLLLALTLALCLVSLHTLSGITRGTEARLVRAHELAGAGAYAAAADAVEDAERLWRSHELFLGAVLRHAESDELQFLFARLPAYSGADNAAEFQAACLELCEHLRHILDTEQPRLYNIF